ncbi:MAG TPA: chromosomal replication initiator protein DnaA [Syntrophales bacterium]|nr:chromosomal replication initiator protein DnaA [Syntrophales bacterium]HNS53184.1 chromosomal replication initiator protein DnaA [Syntrophales bacterium]
MDAFWKKSVDIIKEKVTKQNFDTWISPVRISALEASGVELSVPNRFFRDWLTEHFMDVIKDSVSSVSGVPMSIRFVIDKTPVQGRPPVSETVQSDRPKNSEPADLANRVHPSLNMNYNFERFVVGPSNQFAHAAAVAVAEAPAKNYNPLFIYGGVGLGKTHLLNAIGLHTFKIDPSANVLYVSAEEFMNEMINSIRYDKMQKFREKYRNIDSLLIDDIQFIAGKERTQEEFFHTFNTLHDSGKQIVVTSDKFPKDIPNLEGRLRSRFEWGLIADIQPPEIETKVAIVDKKAQENNISLPKNVAYYIASKAESNIRELEGFIIRIGAYASLTGREIDMDLVKEVLKKFFKQGEKPEVTVEEIMKTVAAKFNIRIADLKSQKKNKNLVIPRQIAMYLARRLTSNSYPDIGAKIGGKDHSTVIYANNKIKDLLEKDPKMELVVREIEESLNRN